MKRRRLPLSERKHCCQKGSALPVVRVRVRLRVTHRGRVRVRVRAGVRVILTRTLTKKGSALPAPSTHAVISST